MKRAFSLGMVWLGSAAVLMAADWPTYRADTRRSCVTSEKLGFPLVDAWVHLAAAPEQAWTGPAKWDAYSGNSGLQSMRNFDPCHYVTVAGERVFYGSSADHGVHCLDASSGQERWVVFADAPVRQPPSIYKGLALFGADDGYAYGVNVSDGSLRWKRLAAPEDHRLPSNGRLISLWPVRTGVMVHQDRAYFAASLAPWEVSLLWCVDPLTGETGAPGTWRRELTGVTLQGACLASADRLYAPQGRSAPLVYQLGDGEPLGAVGNAGGVFCLLDEQERFIAGPENQKSKEEEVRVVDPKSNQQLASFEQSNRVVIAGDLACVHVGSELRAFDCQRQTAISTEQQGHLLRLASIEKALKEKPKEGTLLAGQTEEKAAIAKLQQAMDACERWRMPMDAPHELLVAGDVVFLGLSGEVRALALADGKTVWKAPIDGKAMGLAVANGRLYVSSDRGPIWVFKSS